MKYSSCLYPTASETLAQAEMAMLELYVERAELHDGMRILDLGCVDLFDVSILIPMLTPYSCGWGSAALYFAEIFPNSSIVAFSNSKTQKEHIETQVKAKGLMNLEVITGDVVEYEFEPLSFDRVVSIELFEHMKNYELLMAKVSRALKPSGKLFVHLFSHKSTPYDFEDGWMSTHFFSGGTMPSTDLLHYFQTDLKLQEQWWVSGKHYARTCEVGQIILSSVDTPGLTADQEWLSNMNANKQEVWFHLEETYGKNDAARWFYRWQIFYMACAELFAFKGGDTWGVSHYLFMKP